MRYSSIKIFLSNIFFFIVRQMNWIIPKNNNQIVFSSMPDFSDNARAFFEYMQENFSKEYRLIWLVKERENISPLVERGLNAYYERSLAGIYHLVRSRIIIGTHSDYCNIKSGNQYLIDLWHGMPLKAMGFSDRLETKETLKSIYRVGQADNFLISTSLIMKNALIASFLIDPNKVIITGQPRTDKLFSINANSYLKQLNISKEDYAYLILFAPTFRSWGDRVEGTPEYFKFLKSDKIIEYLKKNKILLVFKLHPYEENITKSQFNLYNFNNKNIRLLTSNVLHDKFIDLYDILSGFDFLITDYSSIFFDYLLLDKPIIFYSPDIDTYSATRGFLLEPYSFWTPGPKIDDVDLLTEELKKFIEMKDYYKKERKLINSIVNKYQDDKSSERVWNTIKEQLHQNKP